MKNSNSYSRNLLNYQFDVWLAILSMYMNSSSAFGWQSPRNVVSLKKLVQTGIYSSNFDVCYTAQKTQSCN